MTDEDRKRSVRENKDPKLGGEASGKPALDRPPVGLWPIILSVLRSGEPCLARSPGPSRSETI
jgi:hypothetical protein